MGSVEMSCLDLECSGSHSSAVKTDGKDENICFSIPEKNSCADSEVGQVMHARRESSEVGSDCIVNIEYGVDEVRISLGTMERECRICMSSLDSESIKLGCSCKNTVGAAHQHCAEKWFKSKGNKNCEICKSIAQNVVIPSDIESRQQIYNKCSPDATRFNFNDSDTTPYFFSKCS